MQNLSIDSTAVHSELIIECPSKGTAYIETKSLMDWICQTNYDSSKGSIWIHSSEAAMITISDCGPVHQGDTYTYDQYWKMLKPHEQEDIVRSYLMSDSTVLFEKMVA